MKKNILLASLVILSGCFLVISHDDRVASVMTVHLLPPRMAEIKIEKPIDAVVALFPFEFDLKFSEKKEPVFLDYSHLPKEFLENLSVIFEGALVSKVAVMQGAERDKDVSYYAKILKEKKADMGVVGRVKKFNISQKKDGWNGNLGLEMSFITYDGILLRKENYEYNFEKLSLPENITLDYQVALAASSLFDKAYTDIVKNTVSLAHEIEAHRVPREVVKKGIFTFRKSDKQKGKTRLLLDIRVRVVINDYLNNILVSKEKISEQIKNDVENIKKSGSYKLVLSVKDKSETIYPFAGGKLNYDANNDVYSIQYAATKEINVSPGKSLVIASFYVPKVGEVITKGVYLDINPEKGASMGFNLICDTKNNYVDMGFVK